MKTKFQGSLNRLMESLEQAGIKGTWLRQPNQVHMFKRDKGGVMHWSETTGSLWFTGLDELKQKLEKRVLAAIPTVKPTPLPKMERKAFLVGDRGPSQDFVYQELSSNAAFAPRIMGSIKKLTRALRDAQGDEPEFLPVAIIILDPKVKPYLNAPALVRPKTLIEMGIVMQLLKRKRCLILHNERIEMSKSIPGVPALAFNDHISETANEFVKLLLTMR